jgi:large subunit ribosomal protein L1
MKHSRKYLEFRQLVNRDKRYTLEEAVEILKANHYVKFNESIEVAVRLGVDPRHADQMVRGTVALPHGTGKSVRIAVFAQGDKAAEAEAAGADTVGADDLAEKIKGGWTDFDVAVATPDMMKIVGPLGKVLGPRGLMPNPKTGTVTMDLTRAIGELKAGRIEFRIDKQANIAASVGKIEFDKQKIVENVETFFDALMKAKPSAAKGTYLLSAALCTTMSPGIKLDHAQLVASLKK